MDPVHQLPAQTLALVGGIRHHCIDVGDLVLAADAVKPVKSCNGLTVFRDAAAVVRLKGGIPKKFPESVIFPENILPKLQKLRDLLLFGVLKVHGSPP